MKKATIKRRKRVIAAQDDAESIDNDGSGRSIEGTPERGTMNDDGSVNLGFRRRAQQLPPIEPRAGLGVPGGQPSPLSTDPATHQTSLQPQQPQQHDAPMYLNEENRLASLATVASSEERQPSLSPASFLSSSRKRSFSAAEGDPPPSSEGSKRVSSIKSILNPADESAQMRYDEGREYAARSPHAGFAVTAGAGQYSPGRGGREASAEGPGVAGRREALRLEAERMRDMLAQKERELAELGLQD